MDEHVINIPLTPGQVGLVNATLVIVSYITPEGENAYFVHTQGDAPASTYLGLTVMAQRDILDWNAIDKE